MEKISITLLVLMALLISTGCSNISSKPPVVHNDRVGTVTAEHAEFQKDAQECSAEVLNKPQSNSSNDDSHSKDIRDVIGTNALSSILIANSVVKYSNDVMSRIGKCVEMRGWRVVAN